MPIGEKKAGGTWWKVLLGVIGGFFLGIGATAGGVAIAGTVVKTKTLLGEENANKYLGAEYQEKTILQIVMDAVQGKMKFETLGDLNNITPMVGDYVTGVKNSLNGIGCELTNEEMYTWPINGLADSIIGAVHNAKLIRVLNAGKEPMSNPDPVIKYLSYETYPQGHEKEGDYVTDDQGNLVNTHLSDLLKNPHFLQNKIDSMKIKMLFTEGDIAGSPLLTAIKEKSVKELSKPGAFDNVKISDVIGNGKSSAAMNAIKDKTIGQLTKEGVNDILIADLVDDKSSKIMQAFAREKITVSQIGTAIDKLYLDDVINDPNPAPVLKKLIGRGSNATEELPYGPEVTTASPDLLHIVYNGEGDPTEEYEYVIFSDGKGHQTDYIPFSKIVDAMETGMLDKTTINIAYNAETEETSYTLSGSTDTRTLNDATFTMNVAKPAGWDKMYALSTNKLTKIGDLSGVINNIKLKDVMTIKHTDPLWKVRNESATDGKLFDSIKNNLFISDIMPDYAKYKFIGAIPGETTLANIGGAIENIKLVDAFYDEIYDRQEELTGNRILNSTWKYMLIEKTESLAVDPIKTELNDPLGGKNCNKYTVGGKSGDAADKGINGLIQNMTDNMARASLKQLKADGIVAGLDNGFLTTKVPTIVDPLHPTDPTYNKYTPPEPGVTEFGDFTIQQLSEFITAVYGG